MTVNIWTFSFITMHPFRIVRNAFCVESRIISGTLLQKISAVWNTCHYFADRLQELTNGKFINMIEETAHYASERGRKKVGVMATDGTVKGGMYKKALEKYGIEVVYPSEERQKDVMSLIYEQIKRGEKGDRHQFMNVVHELRGQGCDAVILACTELSVLNVNYSLNPDFYIDAMNVVAKACIEKCGGVYCE